MLTTPQKAADFDQAAKELLSKARSALGDVDQFFRDEGFEPERVHKAIAACTSQAIADEASAQFDQIWQDVEREALAQQAQARVGSSGQAAKVSKRPRPLV